MRALLKKLPFNGLPRPLPMRQISLFVLIYSIVSIGCLWQIISVCHLFFSYPTLVSVEPESKLCHNELPAFSFCSYLEPKLFQCLDNPNKSTQYYFEKFNLSDKIFEFGLLAPDYQPINETTIPEDLRNSLIQTLNGVYFCYTFNSLIKSKSGAIILRRNEILAIRLDLSQIQNISFLYVHDWYSIPNGWEWNTIGIRPGYSSALSFSKKRFNLLKSPYQTQCIDYEKSTSFISQDQCMANCKVRRSLEECQVIVDDTNVEVNQLAKFARTTSEKNCTKSLNLTAGCWEECPNPDCTIDHYKTIEYYTRPNVDNWENGSGAYVRFKIPTEPQLIFNHKPKIETIEFLCYGASLIGLWFGFSITSVYYPINRVIDWFIKINRKPFHKGRAHSITISRKIFDNISYTNQTIYSSSKILSRLKSV